MDLLRDLALSVVAFVAVGLVFRAGRSARISETLAVAAGTTVIAAVGAIAMFRGRGHAVAVNPQASTLPYSLLGSAGQVSPSSACWRRSWWYAPRGDDADGSDRRLASPARARRS